LTTVATLAARYDAFLVDQFGVLMSGDGPYPGAAAALNTLASTKKPVIILSNSGKRAEANGARLVANGFGRDDFLTVLSSGEVAHAHFREALPPGARVFCLIKSGDTPPLDGLNITRTDAPETADILLIVSRDPKTPLTAYGAPLKTLAARKISAFCVNPDRKMLTPDGMVEAAGHLAALYEAEGGHVTWFGKPHAAVYDGARKMLPGIAADATLCIGDSLDHDIVGGQRAGFKTALVRTGINAPLSDDDVVAAARALGAMPDHFLRAFADGEK
ncbi:MAG: TIGR01459 family HAD-type hydrolase, partial [Pseudomonadota bacterium]